MNQLGNLNFQGVSGSLIVSVIAFTIVFLVLMGLTAVIYAIKLFSASDEDKGQSGAAPVTSAPAAKTAPVQTSAAQTSASASTPSDKAKITAVITAAILAATSGQGRILSITPAEAFKDTRDSAVFESTRVWKSAGTLENINRGILRPWKR